MAKPRNRELLYMPIDPPRVIFCVTIVTIATDAGIVSANPIPWSMRSPSRLSNRVAKE